VKELTADKPNQLQLESWTGAKTIPIPSKQLKCYISGDLVRDTEHERNLQRMAQRLVQEYDFEFEQLDRYFSVQLGSRHYYPDIVAYEKNVPRKKEAIRLAVEIETPDIDPTDPTHGIGQVLSYMQMLPQCKYGIWYNGLLQSAFYKEKDGEQPVEINDIPPYGMYIEDIERPNFGQLRAASELRSVFKRSHNYIAGNQGLRKEAAFQELLKLIFCKALDEKYSSAIQFYVTNNERKERPERCASRINTLFDRVKTIHTTIFDKEENIKLNPSVLAFVVSQLQHYTLLNTDTDVKGEAYEEIVGGNLRGDRGEFFTPRNVCRAAVEMVFYTFPKDKWDDLCAIDPACGTGGFLIATINFLRRYYYRIESEKWEEVQVVLARVEERIKSYCERNLHGTDINPTLARATQMNEVMNGNGHGNVFPANSLKMPSEWNQEKSKIELGMFDVLFANPPFGTKIRVIEPSILENYDIGHIWEKKDGSWVQTTRLRKSVPPEQLFMERSVQLLKPGGRLGMIVADHILTNPGLEFIRQWLLENTKVIARIALPTDTFQPFTGTKSHLVLMERKKNSEKGFGTVEYQSFGAIAQKVGHDQRGSPIYLKTPEGDELLVEIEKNIIKVTQGVRTEEREKVLEKVVNDDMPAITETFKKWWDDNAR
jgi:type I restriction enzyme M protein